MPSSQALEKLLQTFILFDFTILINLVETRILAVVSSFMCCVPCRKYEIEHGTSPTTAMKMKNEQNNTSCSTRTKERKITSEKFYCKTI